MIDKKTKKKIPKLFVLFSIISFIIVILFLIVVPPASGYELSIYDQYPNIFWFLVLLIGFCCISNLIFYYQNFDLISKKWPIISFSLIILLNILVLALSQIRKYPIYGSGDLPFHLGQMRYIIKVGTISQNNIYPIAHILGSNLYFIANLAYGDIAFTLIIAQYIVFIFGMVMLINEIFKSPIKYLALAFSTPLVFSFFHKSIHPAFLAIFLFPIIMYLVTRNTKSNFFQFITALIIFSLILSFIHPLASLIIIILLFVSILTKKTYKDLFKIQSCQSLTNANLEKKSISILLVTFVFWFFNSSRLIGSFTEVFIRIWTGRGSSPVGGATALLSTANLTFYQLGKLILFSYGHLGFYFIICIIGIFYVLKKFYDKDFKKSYQLYRYGILFITGFSIALLFWFNPLIVGTFQRSLRWATFFTLIFTPLITNYFITGLKSRGIKEKNDLGKKSIVLVAVILVVVSSFSFSIFNVYRAPNVAKANGQLTNQRLEGTQWFLENRNENTTVIDSAANLRRIAQYYNIGVGEVHSNSLIPDHFGYEENNTVNETFQGEKRYMLTYKLDKIHPRVFPKNVRDKAHQYNESDFSQLNADPSINKIYNNGEYQVWKTNR